MSYQQTSNRNSDNNNNNDEDDNDNVNNDNYDHNNTSKQQLPNCPIKQSKGQSNWYTSFHSVSDMKRHLFDAAHNCGKLLSFLQNL